MMTHHSVITSSLHIKNVKIDQFCVFSSDIDYNSKTDLFRDVIFLIINQYQPRRSIDASRAMQASEAPFLLLKCLFHK